MAKLAFIPPLVIAACVFAGLYGALHNQLSYTVSPDYFHAFEFPQFRVAEPGRLGTSLVGWRASWWMGILISTPLVLVGLVIPGWRAYCAHVMRSFVVVAGTALLTGLGALLYASLAISDSDIPAFSYPAGVVDKVAFARAGIMHNFSYLGGGLGVLTGSAYLAVARARLSRRCTGPDVG
jgi:hypothetical protein